MIKPSGTLVVCEFSTPTWRPFRTIYSNYLVAALPRIASLVSSSPAAYEYLAESIQAWPDQQGLADHDRRVRLATTWSGAICRAGLSHCIGPDHDRDRTDCDGAAGNDLCSARTPPAVVRSRLRMPSIPRWR